MTDKKLDIYAKKDGFIYAVHVQLENNTAQYGYIELSLVCGWDYINIDDSDEQGWVSADNFTDEVAGDILTWEFMYESVPDALTENGYTVYEHDKVKQIVNRF